MASKEITAKKTIDGVDKIGTIVFDFGEDINQAIELFGAEVVMSNFTKSAIITAQAAIRRMLEAGKTQEEITVKMADWKPGVALERVTDPVASLVARFPTMSAEEQAAVLQKLEKAAANAE